MKPSSVSLPVQPIFEQRKDVINAGDVRQRVNGPDRGREDAVLRGTSEEMSNASVHLRKDIPGTARVG